METLTVTLNNEHARRLLEDLQLLGAITIHSETSAGSAGRRPATYDALRLDTRGFKFNREEANER